MFDRWVALFIIIWWTRFIERATPTFSAALRYLQDTQEWNRVRDLAIFMLCRWARREIRSLSLTGRRPCAALAPFTIW